MDKLHLPTLSESDAAMILQNIARVTCMPEPIKISIADNIMYVSYRVQRKAGVSASRLLNGGFAGAEGYEERYQESLLEASTGGNDE